MFKDQYLKKKGKSKSLYKTVKINTKKIYIDIVLKYVQRKVFHQFRKYTSRQSIFCLQKAIFISLEMKNRRKTLKT